MGTSVNNSAPEPESAASYAQRTLPERRRSMQGKVMTVLGAIEPQDLGITLTHEHLLVDLRVWSQEPHDEEKKALVHAAVDLSTLGAIRRDPLLNLDNCVLDDVTLAIVEL